MHRIDTFCNTGAIITEVTLVKESEDLSTCLLSPRLFVVEYP